MDPRTAETHELPDVGATLAVAFAGIVVLAGSADGGKGGNLGHC